MFRYSLMRCRSSMIINASRSICQEYEKRMKHHLKQSETQQVLTLFDEMIDKHQIKPNQTTYLLAIRSIHHRQQKTEADRLYHLIKQDLSIHNQFEIQTALVHMYAVVIGDISSAEKLVTSFQTSHMTIWSALMTGYHRQKMLNKVIELYEKIQRDDQLKQNRFTYYATIHACTQLKDFSRGREIFNQIVTENDPNCLENATLVASMIHLLNKSEPNISLCSQLFDGVPIDQRSSVLYNAMMKAYNLADQPKETLALFDQIVVQSKTVRDHIHFILVFNACARLGRICLDKAHQLYQTMLEQFPEGERHVRCRNAAIDMFGKCDDVRKAREIFDTHQDLNDIVSWGAMLNTYALHGDGQPMLEVFERMLRDTNIKPNAHIYSTVLHTCSHAGSLLQAKELFSKYNIELPKLWRYVTMIDQLARADRFEEALSLIDQYALENSEPPIMMYISLLNHARRRGLASFAEKIMTRLEMIPSYKSEELKTAYVLLANLYNAQYRNEDAFEIRQLMREKKMIKKPGLTWINIDGVIHEFHANDRRHLKTAEIYEEVTRIKEELRRDGYSIDIHSVPIGSVHGEKLAIAFALISTSPDTPIVLTKNLRLCSGCHQMCERLSRLRQRKIIIRDSAGYHVFQHGYCSCTTSL